MGWLSQDGFNNANKDGYVSYCESHDEERMQYKAKMWGNGDLKTNVTARLNRVPVNVAFNVLLNGPHMLWQFEEIGYDFSINSSYDDPDGTSEDNRCAKKPRPEELGYFDDLVRMEQYTKVAQTIHLRTKLLPNVFEGNPTQANINGGRALRTVQWGKDVFMAGNFSIMEDQTVTIPEGTWYNYFEQEQLTTNSLTLAPGELLILTSTQVELPKVGLDATTGLEDIIHNATQPVPPYDVYVYNLNGQLMNQQTNAMSADLTGLNSGLYIVQYEKNGQRVAKKVIR
jgi:hypothetical protein